METTAGRDDFDAQGMAPTTAVYWNIRDIQFHLRISRSTAWRLVREERFPSPVLHGKRCVLWPSVEVVEFLEARREPDHYRRNGSAFAEGSHPRFVQRQVGTRAATASPHPGVVGPR